jgi:hypothetical protein
VTQQEILEILVKMRGGQQVASESRKVAGGLGAVEKKSKAAEYATNRLRIGSGRLQTRLSLLGRSAFTIAGIAGIGGLVEVGRMAVDSFKEQQVASAQTSAVLRSTGGVAHVTAQEIGSLSEELARKEGVDKASIQTGENVLLSFRHIHNEVGKGNDIFTQASKVTQDLSVARKMDMKTAALWVGKALNDPVKGFARLQRVGVSFSKQQQNQIKLYDALGMRTQAQKVILGELQKVVGGSAAAYGRTLPGALGKARMALTELGVEAGSQVAPYLTIAALAVSKFVTQMRDGTGTGGQFVGMLHTGAHVIGAVLGPPLGFAIDHIGTLSRLLAIGAGAWATYRAAMVATRGVMLAIEAIQLAQMFLSLIPAITSAADAMVLLDFALDANPIGLIVIGIALLVAGFVLLGGHLSAVGHAFSVTWNAIKTGASEVIGFLAAHWPLILAILTGPFGLAVLAAHHYGKAIGNAFISAINFIIRAWDSLHFHVPGIHAFGHHIGGFDLGTPHIKQLPMLAQGGNVATRGAAIVGDAGPELVELPAGARVTPLARQAKQIIQLVVDGRVLAETVFHAAEDAAART